LNRFSPADADDLGPASATDRIAGASLWRLVLTQPHLLAEHLGGYAALVRGDAAGSAAALQRRAWRVAACVGGFTAATVLAGVALMGWAAGLTAPLWAVLAVPAVPLIVALLALRALHRDPPLPLWQALQDQWAADARLLGRHEP
jgi:hypothetical protein